MRRLIAAIGAMLGALKTVTEWCWRAGRMVTRTVLTPFAGGGAPMSTMADDEPEAPAGVREAAELEGIRRLAGAMAADRVTEEDLEPVADARIEWLAAMDRPMLACVLCADDAALRDHLAGRGVIRNVLAADRESVAEYRRAMAMVPDDCDAPAPTMAYAA